MNTILILLLSITTTWARYGYPISCTETGMTWYALEGDLYEMTKCMHDVEPLQLTTDMLVAASCRGQYDVVDWLLTQGVEVHPNRDDMQCAAALGYTGIVRLLLKADATFLGRPFFFAMANGHIGAASALLKAGADPNETIRCYYEIEHAPRWMYNGFKDALSTCEAFADRIAEHIMETIAHPYE